MDQEELFVNEFLNIDSYSDTTLLGDIAGMEKLCLESALREEGLEERKAAAMAGIWSGVVHLRCRYADEAYIQLEDALRVLPEGEFRFDMRRRFLVALGREDFPSRDSS